MYWSVVLLADFLCLAVGSGLVQVGGRQKEFVPIRKSLTMQVSAASNRVILMNLRINNLVCLFYFCYIPGGRHRRRQFA